MSTKSNVTSVAVIDLDLLPLDPKSRAFSVIPKARYATFGSHVSSTTNRWMNRHQTRLPYPAGIFT